MKARQVIYCAVKHETYYGVEYEYEGFANPHAAKMQVVAYTNRYKDINPDFKFSVVWVRANIIEYTNLRFLATCIAGEFVAEYPTYEDALADTNKGIHSNIAETTTVVIEEL